VSDLEPLDPELEALFARERAAHVAEPAARAAVGAGVEGALRRARLAPPAVHGARLSVAAKCGIVAAMAVSMAGGVVVGRVTAPTASAPIASLPPSPTLVASTPAPLPSPTDQTPPPSPTAPLRTPEPTLAPPSARQPPPPSPKSTSPSSSLQKEQELIDTARGALARGRADDALAATEAHAKRFPRGALAEEREALAIQALVLEGNVDAARTRATAFRASYPQSIFRLAVDRALEPH
jgi:hypothetical protein